MGDGVDRGRPQAGRRHGGGDHRAHGEPLVEQIDRVVVAMALDLLGGLLGRGQAVESTGDRVLGGTDEMGEHVAHTPPRAGSHRALPRLVVEGPQQDVDPLLRSEVVPADLVHGPGLPRCGR